MPTGKLAMLARTVSQTHAPPVRKPSNSAQVTWSLPSVNNTVFNGATSRANVSSMTASPL